jgi:hypothetical protein
MKRNCNVGNFKRISICTDLFKTIISGFGDGNSPLTIRKFSGFIEFEYRHLRKNTIVPQVIGSHETDSIPAVWIYNNNKSNSIYIEKTDGRNEIRMKNITLRGGSRGKEF